ncbi:type I phosphomannose isomerase catalytic subunit [Pseudobacteriovorax antillogorgiicola]|nr:type I phosphomannose isomerase catalytic subunit [Pseudobacteriovorax antillogorgiicola]
MALNMNAVFEEPMTVSVSDPVLLSFDQFTPLRRTPWAGTNISKMFKADLVPSAVDTPIGESWEFSCDPAYPSKILSTGQLLADFVREHSDQVLSPKLSASSKGACEILVKLLNAASPLSLQVHPEDGDPNLGPKECGKPESWLVLHAEPGAGIYVGFSRSLDKDELRKVLLDGDRAKDVLQFVPVKPGDYFEIKPGVPHAIGPGVTLLEPQRIFPGKSGKTYRMWDWGRKYDNQGRLDPNGEPRPLHVDEALRIIDPENQVGMKFVRSTMEAFHTIGLDESIIHQYPKNDHYQVHHIFKEDDEPIRLAVADGYGVFLSCEGRFKLKEAVSVGVGQPVLLPHQAMPLSMSGRGQAVLVTPAMSQVKFSKA